MKKQLAIFVQGHKITNNNSNYIFSKDFLQNHYDLKHIGSYENGFTTEDMSSTLRQYNDTDQDSIVIFIAAHGINQENYKIAGSAELDYSIKEIFAAIDEATDKPVKILTDSCFGERYHEYADMLTPGSKLISLASTDRSYINGDNFIEQDPLKEFRDTFLEDNVTLEKLTLLCTLNQFRDIGNVPVVSYINSDGSVNSINTHKYTLNNISFDTFESNIHTDLVKVAVLQSNFMANLQDILPEHTVAPKNYVIEIIDCLKAGNKIESLKGYFNKYYLKSDKIEQISADIVDLYNFYNTTMLNTINTLDLFNAIHSFRSDNGNVVEIQEKISSEFSEHCEKIKSMENLRNLFE